MVELLQAMGRDVKVKADGVIFRGEPLRTPGPAVRFDCDHDHRLAFAAAVLKAAGQNVEIVHPEVVAKSFPEFWDILGWPA
jgi:5-enolpyruvylshikimate-3-phosphate synthase